MRYGQLRGVAGRITAALAAAVTLAACATDECLDNQNSLPLAGFYSSSLEPKAISIDSITVAGIGAPGDSLILDNRRGVAETYLPFQIDSNRTDFRFSYMFTADKDGNNPLSDVVSFEYDIEPYFVSSACGAIYKYRIKNITTTHTFIDSVACPTGVIDNVPGQNIFIYFRTDEEGGDK